jgi:uncharacterized membrane protein
MRIVVDNVFGLTLFIILFILSITVYYKVAEYIGSKIFKFIKWIIRLIKKKS